MLLNSTAQFKIPTIILSSDISVEMVSLRIIKESLIPMKIETFDRIRLGLNSFLENCHQLNHHTKGNEHI